MKKLYIPTSTLNFNNILSSESISPKAFYALRGFGYPRWQTVEENNLYNVVFLYEQPFAFVRPASDMEDHPMLIEIKTDKEYHLLEDGVYCTDQTIYLSPWRTRFIFFSEQDKRVALSISDSSIETKMLGLYRRQLVVESYPDNTYNNVKCEIPLNKEAVDIDVRINKMKGLLYGYYIGALLSTTPELTYKANTLQEIQNIFSSVLSSDSRTPTVLQQQKLMTCFAELQKYNPVMKYLQKVAKDTENVDDIVANLSRFGVIFPSSIDGAKIINSLEYATEDYNPAFDWLKKEKEYLRSEEIEEQTLLTTSSEEVIVTDMALSKIVNIFLTDQKEQQLMKVWVNEVFSSGEYNGKVTTFAEVLSDVVTRKAKEVYGDEWDESRAKVELNQMRRYVRAQESALAWGNDLFSSIAAVLAKGSDWEQLRSFMQGKMIYDYRIVFALYGELNGFANLTRDFTDTLFELPNRKYVAEVYKEIYGQLYGEDPSLDNTVIFEDAKLPVNHIGVAEKPATPTINLEDIVRKIIASHPRIKISEKDRNIIEWALPKAQNDGVAFINMIDNEMESLTKGIFPCLQKELHPQYKPIGKRSRKGKGNQIKEQNLFSSVVSNASKMFFHKISFEHQNKEDIITLISHKFGYDKKVMDSIKWDLDWVLDPKYSEHIAHEELIKKFRDRLVVGKTQHKSSKGTDMTWKNNLYKEIDIDSIIKFLELRCI